MHSPYQPLDPEDQQIRVAVLQPGSGNDTIKIRLRIESLRGEHADEPYFEALSYAWGNESSPSAIQVHNNAMSIGLNLEKALRQFRYPDKERILWVDALCINQADVHERNSQVQLMGRIYSSANTVLVWLGHGDETDKEAIQMIPKLEDWNFQGFQNLARIFERPWFRRVWMVQEFVLARNDPIIYVGASTMNRQVLMKRISHALEKPSTGVHFDSPDEPQCLVDRRFEKAISTFVRLRRMRLQETCTFAENLYLTSSFKATDPRDKAYGILGLQYSSMDPAKVAPDYGKSVCEVLIETSMSMIKYNPLELYARFPLHPLRDEHMSELCNFPGLPSWALDPDINTRYGDNVYNYNQPEHMLQRFRHHMPQSFQRNSARRFPVQCSPFQSLARLSSDNELHIVGKFIGTIDGTSGELLRKTEDKLMRKDPTLAMLRAMESVYDTMLRPKNLHAVHLWRTLSMDPQFLVCEEECQRLFRRQEPPLDKTVFVTSNNRVGLTYHPDMLNGIRPGDVVVGLFGVNLPFVLRQVELSNQYQMINVANVGGHDLFHPELEEAAEGTTEDDIWENLDRYGLQEYRVI